MVAELFSHIIFEWVVYDLASSIVIPATNEKRLKADQYLLEYQSRRGGNFKAVFLAPNKKKLQKRAL